MAHFLSNKLSAAQLSDLQECIRKNNPGKTFNKFGYWYIPDDWRRGQFIWKEFDKNAYPLTINKVKDEWKETIDLKQVDDWLELVKDQKNIYSKILQIYIYAKIGNQARVENILEDILSKEPWLYHYENLLNKNDENIIYSQYLFLLKETLPLVENKQLWGLFIYWMNQFLGEEKSLFPLDVSIPTLKRILRSNHYGLKFPGLWFELINAEFAPIVLDDFLGRSQFWKNMASDNNTNDLWILPKYFPKENIFREIIIQRWIKLLASSDLYQNDYAIRMLNHEEFYQFVVMKKLLPKPLFILKREHYKRLLRTNARPYALFELIKLGESGQVLLDYFASE